MNKRISWKVSKNIVKREGPAHLSVRTWEQPCRLGGSFLVVIRCRFKDGAARTRTPLVYVRFGANSNEAR